MSTRRSNPLALATLVYLIERDRHPYELAADMRIRHLHESVKLNHGSLYGVIATLERQGLIAARATERAGRRPERTVYAVTDAGRREATAWLADLLSTPVKEYPQFGAALALVAALAPDDVADLLDQRVAVLDQLLRQGRAQVAAQAAMELPRLFVLEFEYEQRLLEAERDFVAAVVADLRAGALPGVEQWRRFSSAGAHDLGDPDSS